MPNIPRVHEIYHGYLQPRVAALVEEEALKLRGQRRISAGAGMTLANMVAVTDGKPALIIAMGTVGALGAKAMFRLETAVARKKLATLAREHGLVAPEHAHRYPALPSVSEILDLYHLVVLPNKNLRLVPASNFVAGLRVMSRNHGSLRAPTLRELTDEDD